MDEITNLVFEGGGVKGVAYGGALKQLDALGILDNVKKVAGTSAGAITATLLATGHDANTIAETVFQKDFRDFQDDSLLPGRDLLRVFREYGVYKGNALREWIGHQIATHTGNSELIFAQHQEMVESGEAGFRELHMIATNLNRQKEVHFCYSTTPDLAIADAVRASMSIPVVFQCTRNEDEEVLVDGGASWNFPLHIFDEPNPDPDTQIYSPNLQTLGFRLDSREYKEFSMQDQDVSRQIKNLKDYGFSLVYLIRELLEQRHLEAEDWMRTVFIDIENVRSTDFDLSPDKKQKLMDNGGDGVLDYFQWRNSPEGQNVLGRFSEEASNA